MPAFDIQETTVQIDHTNKLVHFYTTRRSVFLGLVHRNPHFISARELNPGYEVEYRLEQLRGVDKLLKPSDESARDQFLTDAERERFDLLSASCQGLQLGKKLSPAI